MPSPAKPLGMLVCTSLLALAPWRLWAWGCEGHQAMAVIAETRMTSHAREQALALLRARPIDPSLRRFCAVPGLDLMEDAATWADDLRNVRPETGGWHYIDIPLGARRSALREACPASGCILSALTAQMGLLRNPAADPETRAEALRFVIHLVGDLHQPLHCVTNNDMGGNCVPVEFFGNPPVLRNPQYESYAPNLHGIWDYGLIQRAKGTLPIDLWAEALARQFHGRMPEWEEQGVHVEDWIWESHELAASVVYSRLPVAVPVERPATKHSCADGHASLRLLNLHELVAQAYADAVTPVINEQIAKAGVRLAMILNQVWP